MPILWNTSESVLTGKYDGQSYTFQPNGDAGCKKRINSSEISNHLRFKLEDYGLVILPDDEPSKKVEQSLFLSGVKKRRAMLERRVRAFKTMNKEREKSGLSADMPSDLIIETCKELDKLDDLLKELQKEDFAIVNKHLGMIQEDEAEEKIEDIDVTIKTDPTGSRLVNSKSKDAARRGRPKKTLQSVSQDEED